MVFDACDDYECDDLLLVPNQTSGGHHRLPRCVMDD